MSLNSSQMNEVSAMLTRLQNADQPAYVKTLDVSIDVLIKDKNENVLGYIIKENGQYVFTTRKPD